MGRISTSLDFLMLKKSPPGQSGTGMRPVQVNKSCRCRRMRFHATEQRTNGESPLFQQRRSGGVTRKAFWFSAFRTFGLSVESQLHRRVCVAVCESRWFPMYLADLRKRSQQAPRTVAAPRVSPKVVSSSSG
eukprot:scaffold1954_cov268-Pinguiococcus_pyrenoidosus.AAC.26